MHEKADIRDFDGELPGRMPTTVILKSTPSSSPWIDQVWDAVGVVVGDHQLTGDQGQDGLFYFTGLQLELFVDEAESYYHNLMSPNPSCYVVARIDEIDGSVDDMPVPVFVTLSFDQAHAYLEGDDQVFAVPIPPELYRWTEAFVLHYYAPEKKYKRKLKNWKPEGKPS